MEQELAANDHKGGWSHMSTAALLRRLRQELGELAKAIADGKDEKVVASEAGDVANFAMMIAENYRRPPYER
jgi:NTP pyrophosphatase (non-canonical NTP hydrolase)